MKGRLITFEGCEGAGKSKQLELLKEYFSKSGKAFVFAREPGGAVISEKIRAVVLDSVNDSMTFECEALLYAAARAQLISEVVLPALNSGKLVLLDRYIDSSFAYQAYARGLGLGFIEKINSYAIDKCMPDATIFLDIDPKTAFERKGGADLNDRLELSGIDFHNKVYNGYLKLAEKFPHRITAVKGEGGFLEIHKKIIDILFKKGLL